MSAKKKHNPAPIPPGNRQQQGPAKPEKEVEQSPDETRLQEEDPKRRLGDFTGTAEHSMQEPGGKQGSNH
jgi:hypothetical protein